MGREMVLKVRTATGLRLFIAAVAVWCLFCLVAASVVAFPAGRSFEQVSPLFKGGFGALRVTAVSLDGERVAFYSPGAFAEAPAGLDSADYISQRTITGWRTTAMMAPTSLVAQYQVVDLTPSLETEFELGYAGSSV